MAPISDKDPAKERILQDNPALRPYLQRVARHAATAARMPARIVMGPTERNHALLPLLNTFLSGRCQIRDGKFTLLLPGSFRDPALWRPLVALSQYRAPADAARGETRLAADTAKRLRLLYPRERGLIDKLEERGILAAYIKDSPERALLYIKLLEAYTRLGETEAVTLSQLGSDVFNDSKALRGGALHSRLVELLRVARDQPELESAALLAHCGVIDNPYTTHVAVFAPITLAMASGSTLDFPQRLFALGQAVILPWETVSQVESLVLNGHFSLITSENAAPFHNLARAGRAALYTAGYPNSAARLLLRRFAEAGVRALHGGDTDLDGYRIAEQVGQCIELAGLFSDPHTVDSGEPSLAPYKALTEARRSRLQRYLEAHPRFRFRRQLEHTLEHGWLEQETLPLP